MTIGRPIDGILDDPLDDLLDAPAAPRAPLPVVEAPSPAAHVEPCTKCGGSGRFRAWSGRDLGQCHKCKGTGKLTFKTAATTRARNRATAKASAARNQEENLAAFDKAHPIEALWIEANRATFGFAANMHEAVRKYGALTEGQTAAVQRCILAAQARVNATKARVEQAQPLDTTAIDAAFATASAKLKRPRLIVAGFKVSHAPATGKNPGALYVKDEGGQYLGKIAGGKFTRGRDCTDAQEAEFRAVAADPKGAAIRYGRMTGQCAICGRTLENKESIERGIGPICAANFGW